MLNPTKLLELLSLLCAQFAEPALSGPQPVLAAVAAFCSHVCEILSLSSEEQMGWVHATTVVAAVTHAHTVRALSGGNGPVVDLPREPMSCDLTFSVGHDSVSVVAHLALPLPALVWSA